MSDQRRQLTSYGTTVLAVVFAKVGLAALEFHSEGAAKLEFVARELKGMTVG